MLPDDLYRRLTGADIERRATHALVLCTVSAEGWPHPSMLSYFEVAALDRHNLRLAVYANSRTCGNLRARGRATLIAVDERLVCYIRGTVEELAPSMRVAAYNAKLNMRVEEVRFDRPARELEGDVHIRSGITFTPRTGAALAQAHAVLAELLEA